MLPYMADRSGYAESGPQVLTRDVDHKAATDVGFLCRQSNLHKTSGNSNRRVRISGSIRAACGLQVHDGNRTLLVPAGLQCST